MTENNIFFRFENADSSLNERAESANATLIEQNFSIDGEDEESLLLILPEHTEYLAHIELINTVVDLYETYANETYTNNSPGATTCYDAANWVSSEFGSNETIRSFNVDGVSSHMLGYASQDGYHYAIDIYGRFFSYGDENTENPQSIVIVTAESQEKLLSIMEKLLNADWEMVPVGTGFSR